VAYGHVTRFRNYATRLITGTTANLNYIKYKMQKKTKKISTMYKVDYV